MAGEESGTGTTLSSRAVTSFVRLGYRTMFTVELRPGETTIVSWKKLMKDAARAEGSSSTALVEVPANTHPGLESRLASGPPAADEPKDAPPPNRFSAVIEKIERLYTGKDSSDEEDLGDIPDDDQYDTEDSFIDDAELDEYFEVDKSKTKHDGFFVNKGQLERIEPLAGTLQQPKKRRRKVMEKAPGENDHGEGPNKHMKVGRKRAGKISALVEKEALPSSNSLPVKGSQSNALGSYPPKIATDGTPVLGPVSSLKVSNGNVLSSSLVVQKNVHKRMTDKPGSGKNVQESEISIQEGEKSRSHDQIDLNVADVTHSMQVVKTSITQKKEGASVRPKGNMLEKAIRELEKMVAESRPPSADVQDADSSSQGVKRRLPREIKQKLAKVARHAQASYGKVPEELVNRLMSSLGHLVQVRTLKRNLRIMMNMSLSANQEKHDKYQQIKNQVVEMIKVRAPFIVSKAGGQEVGGSDDFQESGHEDKGALKGQYSMDAALEDKICDLYDIFVDGLDEDLAPQARRLYAELAELWPSGVMDNHGIKRAICRAKERRRALHGINKEQEKMRRKKLAVTKIDDTVQAELNPAAQLQHSGWQAVTESGFHVTNSQNRFTSSGRTIGAATMLSINPPAVPVLSTNASNIERVKPQKLKATVDGTLAKKKVKRKPETDPGGTHLHPEKLSSYQSHDRQKSQKHSADRLLQAAPQKSNYQLSTLPGFQPLT